MTHQDVYELIAKKADLTVDQAADLLKVLFELIAREMSVGEKVNIDDFGTFLTLEHPAEEKDDSKKTILLSYIEPDFEPDKKLVQLVEKAQKAHPEIFATSKDDEEDGEAKVETVIEGTLEKPKPVQAEGASEGIAEEAKLNDESKPKEKPLGRGSDIEFIEIGSRKIDKDILSIIPLNIAKQYNVVPVDLEEGVLTVAMIDPEDFDALQEIRKQTHLQLKPMLTTREDINGVLDQYTGLQAEVQEVISASDFDLSAKEIEEASQENVFDESNNENSPTVKIVYSLLRRAIKEKASDIHIEPYEKKVVVRFRVDGILQQRLELPKEIQSAIISRLKIMANLKIDEQRLPQDGRFNISVDRRQVDFRFSTIPVVYGEKIVMRILDKTVGIISLEDVGLMDRGLDVLKKNMERTHGMILVTGPTGSGKTTSLYAVLGKLMNENVNIITLEDPVEYRIESINQSQVHVDIGYGFAAGLRAVVRQDPDIVMLGEIRDQETADMAIHAALTGHVVLSTLHTNDAAGSFPRLIDMKIEPFLITSSVHTVIAQRLARKICDNCREEIELSKELVAEIKEEIGRMPTQIKQEISAHPLKFYHGKGCDRCAGKGYKGRIGVFEVLDVSEDIRDLILKRSSGTDITNQAIKEGMVTMVQDGIIKTLKGLTTIEEVWRVTRE